VVSLQRIYHELFSKCIVDFLEDNMIDFCHFFVWVLPDRMGRHISSPEQNVGLQLVLHELEHLSHNCMCCIAIVLAPVSSCVFWVRWISVLFSTAKRHVAILVCSRLIKKIYMYIREVSSFESLSCSLLFDWVVQIVNEVIRLQVIWLFFENSLHEIVLVKLCKNWITICENSRANVVRGK